jgi:glycosyltransferase involved in cell wall biosynthesis
MIVIVGVRSGASETRELEALITDTGAKNILLRPEVPVPQVAAYLYAADCLIIPPTDAPLRRYQRTVLPMKVFSYLAAGRPIVAPAMADVQEVLVDGENACLVPPDDPPEAARALQALLSNPDRQSRLSEGALSTASEFTWEARARKIVSFLADVHF